MRNDKWLTRIIVGLYLLLLQAWIIAVVIALVKSQDN